MGKISERICRFEHVYDTAGIAFPYVTQSSLRRTKNVKYLQGFY